MYAGSITPTARAATMPLLLPSFLNSVIALGVHSKDGVFQPLATGFVYRHFAEKDEKGHSLYFGPYLVTNRHVVDEPKGLWVRINDPQSSVVQLREDWYTHPDPEVDVAVIGFNLIYEKHREVPLESFLSDAHAVFRDGLQDTSVMESDEVYTLGFPLGLTDTQRNYVIVRQGIIARIRDWYEGQSKSFLIDAEIFPGNSGGPVMLKPTMYSYGHTRVHPKLIGMVAAYLRYETENSGLAKIVPIDQVRETIAAERRASGVDTE